MTRTSALPNDFIEQLSGQLSDEELAEFQSSLSQPPTISIRGNPYKQAHATSVNDVPWCSTGRYLNERPSYTLDPLFHAGAYYVQEASSMFLEQAVRQIFDLTQPLNVLDLCAAPGGKSTHLLSMITSESLLVSNEVNRARANTLCENICKWGLPNVVVTQNDPEHFKKLNGFFDLVVVDAPCSGEGLFRKEPDAMDEWSPGNVALCSQRQRRILSDVFSSLKQNGLVIYCTCTFNKLENEGTLNWLAAQHDIEFLPIATKPSWGIEEVNDARMIGYRFYPHKTRGEGFFISAFRKKAPALEWKMRHRKDSPMTNKNLGNKISEWLHPSDLIIESVNNDIVLLPRKQFNTIEILKKELRVLMAGTTFGTVKHEKIIPDHALALTPLLNYGHIEKIEVSKANALRYLRKESFEIENQKVGFALVTYLGIGLGWVNCLGNRFNNLYPTNWRIRMK